VKLLRNSTVGVGQHRYGWPAAKEALTARCDGRGMLLDDFVEASHTYHPLGSPIAEPWVGIFHHPVNISSPLASDNKHAQQNILRIRTFTASATHLRGAIALAPDLAAYLRHTLGPSVKVLELKHPAEQSPPHWLDAGLGIFQIGCFLRDTRFIYSLDSPLLRSRIRPWLDWDKERDHQLQCLPTALSINNTQVDELYRLRDSDYDFRLQHSIAASYLFGAAANNTVVECIARGTPLMVNRHSEVESYLGAQYPLYYGEETGSIHDAHEHMRSIALPSVDTFAQQVKDFVDELQC